MRDCLAGGSRPSRTRTFGSYSPSDGEVSRPNAYLLRHRTTGPEAHRSDARSQWRHQLGIRNLRPLAIFRAALGRITAMLNRRAVLASILAAGFGPLAFAAVAAEQYPNRVIK